MSSSGNSAKVIVLALASNLGIAAAKLVGAFFSGSASLLAEAIHSLVDCANQLLLLLGSKRARRAPTKLHPLGFGRESFFWSFVVAVLLFSLGGLFAIYEGVHKLSDHAEVSSPWLGLGILLVSVVLEAISFRACIREVRAQSTHASLWVWFRKTTSSELLVVFTEDAAALLGLVVALASLTLSWLTGNGAWDAAGSIAVGGVLVTVAALLANEIRSLIIGEAPSTDFRSFLGLRLEERLPGARVLNLIALQIGANEVMLSCKITPGSETEVKRLIEAINSVEAELRTKFPEIRWLFVEPDFHD